MRSFNATPIFFANANATSYEIPHLNVGDSSIFVAVDSDAGPERWRRCMAARFVTWAYTATLEISVSVYSPGTLYSGICGRVSASFSSSRTPRMANIRSSGNANGPNRRCGIFTAVFAVPFLGFLGLAVLLLFALSSNPRPNMRMSVFAGFVLAKNDARRMNFAIRGKSMTAATSGPPS